MVKFDVQQQALVGQAGSLAVAENDEVAPQLVMLIEGECEGLGPVKAAAKYDSPGNAITDPLHSLSGLAALLSQARGPKRNYRRTGEVVHQVIRHRFLDPDATTEVIRKSCGSPDGRSAPAVWNALSQPMAFKNISTLPAPRRRRKA